MSINIDYAFPGVHTHYNPVVLLERLTTPAIDKQVPTLKKQKAITTPILKRQVKVTQSPESTEKSDDTSSELDEEETPLKFLKLSTKNGRYSLIFQYFGEENAVYKI